LTHVCFQGGSIATVDQTNNQWRETGRVSFESGGVVVFQSMGDQRQITISASSKELKEHKDQWHRSGFTRIRFMQMIVTKPILEQLVDLREIETIDFAEIETEVSGEALSALIPMNWLTGLYIDNTSMIGSHEWGFVSSLRHLKDLGLGGPLPPEADIPLDSLHELEHLTIFRPNSLTIEKIRRMSGLHSASISVDDKVGLPALVSALQSHEEFVDLHVGKSVFSTEDLQKLSSFVRLESLSLGGMECSNLSPIESLRNLTSLELNFQELKDFESLVVIQRLRTLKNLTISRWGVGNRSLQFEFLRNHPSIEVLRIRGFAPNILQKSVQDSMPSLKIVDTGSP
jgi:hypothetical protein